MSNTTTTPELTDAQKAETKKKKLNRLERIIFSFGVSLFFGGALTILVGRQLMDASAEITHSTSLYDLVTTAPFLICMIICGIAGVGLLGVINFTLRYLRLLHS